MKVSQARSLMFASLLVAICAVSEGKLFSTPAPPPQCDTSCWDRQGPFITGSDDTGICYRFSLATCEYCTNASGSYLCEKNATSTGNKCDVVWFDGVPTFKLRVDRFLVTNPDPTKTPCVKYCSRQAPGYEAIKNVGSVDQMPGVNMDLMNCKVQE